MEWKTLSHPFIFWNSLSCCDIFRCSRFGLVYCFKVWTNGSNCWLQMVILKVTFSIFIATSSFSPLICSCVVETAAQTAQLCRCTANMLFLLHSYYSEGQELICFIMWCLHFTLLMTAIWPDDPWPLHCSPNRSNLPLQNAPLCSACCDHNDFRCLLLCCQTAGLWKELTFCPGPNH